MCPPSLMGPPPVHRPVHDNTTPGPRGRPLRDAKRPITLRRRLIGGFERPDPPRRPPVPGPDKRGAPPHDQEAFVIAQNVHPHPPPPPTRPRRGVPAHNSP